MSKYNLENLLKFVDFTNKFREVERVILTKGLDRKENDAEHSYQLAIVAWYLIETLDLKYLNLSKVFEYSLVHDLVEIYAGDTYVFEKDQSKHDDKAEREKAALNRMEEEFKEFSGFVQSIEEYERMNNEESKFVYALDKLIPILNIYLDNGRNWKELDVKFEEVDPNKRPKISNNKDVLRVYDDLYKLLEEKKDELFSK